MPRSFYPRRTVEEGGVETTDTAPEIVELTAVITSWEDDAFDGDGSTSYRIVAVVPFDGEVAFAQFVPDKDIAYDTTKHWTCHLVNSGKYDANDNEIEITNAVSTWGWTTAREVYNFDPADVIENGPGIYIDPLQVSEDDLIVWRAVQTINGDAEDATASPRLTGMVRIGIRRHGGS